MSSEKQNLLSSTNYDADASSIHSTPDQDTDSSSDHLHSGSRTNLSLSEHDRTVLQDEEETEKLLAKPNPLDGIRSIFSASNPHDGQIVKVSKKDARRQRRRKRRSARRKERDGNREQDEGEVMYEMEEGFKDTSSQASSASSSVDLKGLGGKVLQGRHDRRPRRKGFCRRMLGIHIVLLILFGVLAFGAYKASTKYRKVQTSFTLSNGTHLFAPTTILISLDGFRADFLNRGLTPTLNEFISQGVSPRYMLPSFPSVTFPNHFTLVTGLYPESHGVVGNSFWDPVLAEEFYYTDPTRSLSPKWWTAEPLWVTAEKQGVRTAIHMWPGSEAHIPPIEPTYVDKFNETEVLPRKVDRVLGFLDLPGDADNSEGSDLRPQLIAAYVPNVDADGHLYGPNSTEIRATIWEVDSMLADILEGINARNLSSIVNIIVVSDHGMATTSTDRLIQLDDLIDMDLVQQIDGWPLRGLRLKNPDRDLKPMYDTLIAEAANTDSFDVYTRETMPKRYHFSNNARIAPLWVVPKTGWAVVERTDFDIVEAKAKGQIYHPKGLHGYDHEHPLMRAIAVMRGPSFPHKPNSRVQEFQNTEIYNIVCDSLGIEPEQNNGTLRLPLKPVGLHKGEVPNIDDPPSANPDGKKVWGLPSDADLPAGASSVDSAVSTSMPDSEEILGDVDPEDGDQRGDRPENEHNRGSFFEIMKEKLNKAKEWAKGVLEALKGSGWHDADEDSGDKD